MFPLRVSVEVEIGGDVREFVCTFDYLRPFPTEALDAFFVDSAAARRDGETSRFGISERLFDSGCKGVTFGGEVVQLADLDAKVKDRAVGVLLLEREVRGKEQPRRSSETGSSSAALAPASPTAQPSLSSEPATDAPTKA